VAEGDTLVPEYPDDGGVGTFGFAILAGKAEGFLGVYVITALADDVRKLGLCLRKTAD
jgi:hypothetical protein